MRGYEKTVLVGLIIIVIQWFALWMLSAGVMAFSQKLGEATLEAKICSASRKSNRSPEFMAK